MTLALAPEVEKFWWLSIGLGGVIVAVVIVLLSLLVALVKDIDSYVDDLWTTAEAMAANTATTWQLDEAVTAAGRLRQEVES